MRATTTTSARRSGRRAVLALTAVAGFALLPVAPATAATSNATISNFTFSPNPLTIPVGTTVQWTNDDSVTHTVTANDGSFDSNDVSPHGTFTHTFNQAGTIAYHCNIHQSMHGTITVEAATTTTAPPAPTTTTTAAPTTATTAAPTTTTTARLATTTTTRVTTTTTTRPAPTSTTRAAAAPTTTTTMQPPTTAPADTSPPPNQVANGATTRPVRHSRAAGPVALAAGAALTLGGAGWWAMRGRRRSGRPG